LKQLISYIFVSTLLLGCSSNNGEAQSNVKVLFDKGIEVGKAPMMINEASGLATSVVNEGSMWTHNDSGGLPRIFLISGQAVLQAIVTLDGVENRDWEDIIVGSGPDADKSYIYISETGDNEGRHTTKYIYMFEEPVIDSIGHEPVTINISDFTRIPIEYPDGMRDAETLIIDNDTKDLYIISKREANVNVYVAKYPQSVDEVNILMKLGSLPYHNIVAGDVSVNDEILLKTYDNIYYWKREPGEKIFATLSKPATILPYKPEPQGESITWKRDGSGFFTLSERNGAIIPELLYYKRN